jgi:3-hydroxyacyl-[acyl-carrier-protein] dehydratase
MSETQGAAMVPVDYDIRKILSALPHRYPMLLVDRVVAMAPGDRCMPSRRSASTKGSFRDTSRAVRSCRAS